MRVLLTRPEADARALSQRLSGEGIEALVEPMLTIVPVPGAKVELAGVRAVLVTSANGARALGEATARRDVTVYAVGDSSAVCAREVGFADVVSAGGDVETLAEKVIRDLDPGAGALLHVAGTAVAGDLAGALADAGFTTRRAVLYEARPSETLSPACAAALEAGTLDAALFFSPRTAATFARLVRDAGLEERCASIEALCLSPAVAEAAAAIPWRRLRVAATPNQESLLELLDPTNT